MRDKKASHAAVFLDRDGVLIEDRGLLVDAAEIHLCAGVGRALQLLKAAGFRLVVASNQAVVARGLIGEPELEALHREIQRLIECCGGPLLDAVYYCPHHPEATLPAYRIACPCRKPRPGMLVQAARDHDLDLAASFLVGDRLSDIMAGAAAGCRTVLVQTGMHDAPPIVAADPIDGHFQPNFTCPDLTAAAEWILQQTTERP